MTNVGNLQKNFRGFASEKYVVLDQNMFGYETLCDFERHFKKTHTTKTITNRLT